MKTTNVEKVQAGAFVKVASLPYGAYGFGKVTQLNGAQATVTFFNVPGESQPFEIQVNISALRVANLPEQTRVFRLDDDTGKWQVGRVIDGDGAICLIAFPNGQSANVPRSDLEVRWRNPITDPVAFLARYVTETPRFADARSRFMRAVTSQRAACRGMGALLSSCVQLTDYQFNVVQRVLQDPVQRYLLADEVGLGKTVEAGLLVRQYLLDSARAARVLVIVPAPLVRQWRQELMQRFNLGDWLDDFIYVVGSDELEAIEEHLPSVGMLVVDEAHHLSRAAVNEFNPLYELLQQYAHQVPRLLLLSATPVLSDTAGFLRILHLLDPVVFPLDDLQGFERRLQGRQLVAELVASLVPENVLSMEDDLDRLQQAFSDDETLIERVDALRPIVQALPNEDDERFISALAELRSYLTEAYKLHRRILRNRRQAVPWATPRRSGLQKISFRSRDSAERYQVLDELRVHLLSLDLLEPVVEQLFAASVHPNLMSSIEEVIATAGIEDAHGRALSRRVDALSRQCAGDGARSNATLDAVLHLLETSGPQVVVFCDRVVTADRVTEVLATRLPTDAVRRHTCIDASERSDDEVDEPWRLFLTDPSLCRVLVCDARAEEGLNLHGGRKVALHYDLPASPNRIEQRLGRLDRFGAGDAICSYVVVCADDPSEQAWLTCLHDGLQIFDLSMASLQYLVEATLRGAVADWSGEGVQGLLRWCAQLAGPGGWATRERRRIDQQDALDAMGEPKSDAYDHLEAVDDDWRSWREAFDGFALETLQFRRRAEEWTGVLPSKEQVFRLNYARDGTHHTLLPLTTFVSEFIGTIDTETRHSTSRSPLTHPYAFHRNTVLSKEGQARGLRPLRYGDALVESLRSFCSNDDRGRVFAMWRHWPGYEARDASGVDLFYRFDFLIEADIADGDDDATRALRRRAEGHFPPQFHTVWIDVGGAEFTDARAFLSETYRPEEAQDGSGRDYNMNPRRWQLLQLLRDFPWTTQWSQQCAQANARARSFIAAHPLVREQIKCGLGSLQSQHENRAAQLGARIARLIGAAKDAEFDELRAEAKVHGCLVESIRLPSVRMDVAGAMFVSPTTPFAQ